MLWIEKFNFEKETPRPKPLFLLVSNKEEGFQEPSGRRLKNYWNLISEEGKINSGSQIFHSVLTDLAHEIFLKGWIEEKLLLLGGVGNFSKI